MADTVIEYGARALHSSEPPGTGGSGVSVEVLGARICALASRMAQATYRWLAMIAEFDDRGGWAGVGIKSCAHWLAWTCSIAPGTAREHVRVARALKDLPLVSAEMAAGRLSYAKVREISRVTDRVEEERMVTLARTATASQLARTVRGFRRADGARGRQEQLRRARWFTDDDGSVVLSVRLPADEGAAVVAALEAARDDLHRLSGVPGAPVEAADMVLQWARGYLTSSPKDRSGEDRTTVVVHVSAEHLTGGGGIADAKRSRGNASDALTDAADRLPIPAGPAIPADCCQIPAVGGIERETAQRLACEATLIGVIRGAGGAVLAHGRRRRLVSSAQRRLLQIRDGQCRFPSCQRVSHLEAHHVRPWSRGGRTDPDNLVLLCRFHHVACHEGGVVMTPADHVGRWHFATAEGDPIAGQTPLTGQESAVTGWKHDSWILWNALDASAGWRDPEATRIWPTWAGERFSLADTVAVLFAARRRPARGPTRGPARGPAGDQTDARAA